MDEKRSIIDVLNRIQYIEYSSVWYYPRVAERIAQKDKSAADVFIKLGEDSVHHSDDGVKLIRALGGEPVLEIAKPPEDVDVVAVLQHMLEMEKMAAWLYREAAGLADNPEIKKNLLDQIPVEESHAEMVEDILLRLTAR